MLLFIFTSICLSSVTPKNGIAHQFCLKPMQLYLKQRVMWAYYWRGGKSVEFLMHKNQRLQLVLKCLLTEHITQSTCRIRGKRTLDTFTRCFKTRISRLSEFSNISLSWFTWLIWINRHNKLFLGVGNLLYPVSQPV